MDVKRILVYKRTHHGDPDSDGCFGTFDCMGRVRDWNYDAVIGIGGVGSEARAAGLAGKVNWIGIGPQRVTSSDGLWRGSLVTFDHFLHYGEDGDDLRSIAPKLATWMYGVNRRRVVVQVGDPTFGEALEILSFAAAAPASASRRPPPRKKRQCRRDPMTRAQSENNPTGLVPASASVGRHYSRVP